MVPHDRPSASFSGFSSALASYESCDSIKANHLNRQTTGESHHRKNDNLMDVNGLRLRPRIRVWTVSNQRATDQLHSSDAYTMIDAIRYLGNSCHMSWGAYNHVDMSSITEHADKPAWLVDVVMTPMLSISLPRWALTGVIDFAIVSLGMALEWSMVLWEYWLLRPITASAQVTWTLWLGSSFHSCISSLHLKQNYLVIAIVSFDYCHSMNASATPWMHKKTKLFTLWIDWCCNGIAKHINICSN